MIATILLESMRRNPTKLAVVDPHLRLSYTQLIQMALCMRQATVRETENPRVALMLPSSAAFVSSFFGVAWAGRIPVPVNFLLQPAEVAAILTDAGVDLLVTTRFFEKQAESLPVRKLFVEEVLASTAAAPGREGGPRPEPPQCREDDIAVILYTSGSTGAPKGVCLSHANLLSNCRACIEHARMNPDQRFLGVLPPFHAFGLLAMLLAPVALGATVHYLLRFQPAQVVETIQREAISVFMAVPSMYAALLRLKDAPADSFRPLALAISGGEPLPLNVYAAFEQRWGVRLLEGYGLTETSPVVSINMPWGFRPGSVGRTVQGVQVRIADERGMDAATGREGEVWVRGPNVMRGYYGRPEETEAVIDSEGWFHTGDIGRVDEDGFLFITGRIKDLIIVGGDNVYPREVESALVQHPAVAEAAVLGLPDPGRGEVVVACVTLREGAKTSEAELRGFCRERLAGFKVPRILRILPELPRGPTGKVLKRPLAELVAGQPDGR